jgi:hypothetical protein
MKILISAVALAGLMGLGVTSASAANSPAYCDSVAKSAANQKAGGNAIGGAVVGGVGGAILGGILGKGNKAVVPGAIAGAVGGGVIGRASWKRAYDEAYYQCLNAPPVYAAPPPAYLPPVGSYEWVQACDGKYKTFNPQTGYFIARYDAAGQPVYMMCSLP